MLRNKNRIRIAALVLILLFALSAVACTKTTAKVRTPVTPDKDPTVIVVDKSFTDDLLKEKGVAGGQIYLQNGSVIGVILAAKDADEKDIEKIADKYSKEMKSTYKDMKVNFQALKDGKNIVNINLD